MTFDRWMHEQQMYALPSLLLCMIVRYVGVRCLLQNTYIHLSVCLHGLSNNNEWIASGTLCSLDRLYAPPPPSSTRILPKRERWKHRLWISGTMHSHDRSFVHLLVHSLIHSCIILDQIDTHLPTTNQLIDSLPALPPLEGVTFFGGKDGRGGVS